MEEPSESDSDSVPPSDLLRRQPSVSYFLVLCFSAASSRNSSGDYFYSRFLVKTKLGGQRSTASEPRGPR